MIGSREKAKELHSSLALQPARKVQRETDVDMQKVIKILKEMGVGAASAREGGAVGVDGLVGGLEGGVGFLHFNGGGNSKNAFFNNSPKDWQHLKKQDWVNGEGWRLAKFYVDLPWSWLLFMEEGKAEGAFEGGVGKYECLGEWVGFFE